MGTDGLFDNLFDEDIEKCLKPAMSVDSNTKKVQLKDAEGAA